MPDQTFDDNFFEQTVQGANSTKMATIPEGEYRAQITKLAPDTWTSRDHSKSGKKLTMQMQIQEPPELQGRAVKFDVMLDYNEAGSLDMSPGKNIRLGRLREAVGLNSPTQPFQFRQLEGCMLKIRVSHRVDGDNVYEDVKGVARLS